MPEGIQSGGTQEGKAKTFSLGKPTQPDANSTTTSADASRQTELGRPTSPSGDERTPPLTPADRSGDAQARNDPRGDVTQTARTEEQAQARRDAMPNQEKPDETQMFRSETGGTFEGNDTLAELAAQSAVDRAGVTGDAEGVTLYSTHPIRHFVFGEYESVDGILRIKNDEVEKFEDMVKKLPPIDQSRIVKLDTDRVQAIVDARKAAVQGIDDSGTGRDALSKLHQDSPTVGMRDIAHAARPQQDHNVPLIPTEPIDPEGKSGLDQGPHVVEDSGTQSAV